MLKINFKKNRRSRTTLYLIVISLLLIQFYNLASPGIAADPVRTDTSVQVANDMINNSTVYPDLLVLDVRTVEEFNTNHLHNATLIPLAELAGRLAELAPYNDTEIIVYCRSGSRSLQASNILVANNFTKIFNMLGGINAWIGAGYGYWLNNDPVRTDISVNVANDMINNNTAYPDLLVLDVRTVEEFNTNHLHNATLIPLAELAGRLAELASYNDTEIIVYCQSGSRSLQASDILVANNFTKIFNMLGGINTWINAGYDYWLNENAPSIDIVVIVVVFVSIIGIVAVLVLFYSRRLKVRKRD